MHPCCLRRLYAFIQLGNSPCMVPLLQRMCLQAIRMVSPQTINALSLRLHAHSAKEKP